MNNKAWKYNNTIHKLKETYDYGWIDDSRLPGESMDDVIKRTNDQERRDKERREKLRAEEEERKKNAQLKRAQRAQAKGMTPEEYQLSITKKSSITRIKNKIKFYQSKIEELNQKLSEIENS